MPNAIVHFEIPADDVERARRFYQKAFGWKISDPWKMEYFLVETRKKGEDGINGGLMQRKMPDQRFTNYLSVASVDAACRKIEEAGGAVVMPKTEISADMGWFALFRDTEGNVLGVHEAPRKPARKAAKKTARKAAKKKAAKRRSR
jgi:predicted enzyme related to lactoylglutathione lyase